VRYQTFKKGILSAFNNMRHSSILRLLTVVVFQSTVLAQNPSGTNAPDGKGLPDLSALASMFPKGKDWDSPILNITIPPGPYKVSINASSAFPDRTIYYPLNTGGQKIPVLAWENGMCYRYGLMYYDFLNELASHGYFIIVPGEPTKVAFPQTKKAWQTASIEMAKKWKDSAPFIIDTSKIAVGGHSCGGIESIANLAADTNNQITTAILLNTGGRAEPDELNFRVPTLWIGGGPLDIAYKATQASFAWLKKNKPELSTWKVLLIAKFHSSG
jgi:hypothetical protein